MESKHHPSHSHPPSSQSRDWEHSQTTPSSPFHHPPTTPSPTPPALSALHSPFTVYRFLVQLHLLIDASQIRQLRLTQRVVTETAVLTTRTVVRDVEKHTPHFLRVVTVDAPLYSLIRTKLLTCVAMAILQQVVAQRGRTFVEELAILVGATTALVEPTERLLLYLLARFFLHCIVAQSPTTSFRFDSRATAGGSAFFFVCLVRFGFDSSISSGWY